MSVSFSEYGVRMGDGEYDGCVSLIAQWVHGGWTDGASRALVIANFRKVTLSNTAVTAWTIIRLLQEPEMVYLAFNGCRNVPLGSLADILSLRSVWARGSERLPSLDSGISAAADFASRSSNRFPISSDSMASLLALPRETSLAISSYLPVRSRIRLATT
ncbi:hypothetical protein M427DRAFT_61295 [Gonapodya prolifera JEL478]|uniref:F-box domain-containing protein n=1 Tax=Gonapodya prolifera (strain JEL478) TaxID=1344416 RepID=A0A139A2K4_GONPJ|nr:hypothetical protein M427DRAFT_61295 [Gonapodya prolifera JEL478]|eukprot:KXS10929.1 hypothetical protein M427DRAFT_61295 [Gonapodya prolifera JEL478]